MPNIIIRKEGTIRKLAAIMFTDIAGYTTLMGQDEEKALRLYYSAVHPPQF